MKILAMFLLLLLFAITAESESSTLEWSLRVMERSIPKNSKESPDEAIDYQKHKEDFKEVMKVILYTIKYQDACTKFESKTSSITMILTVKGKGVELCYAGRRDRSVPADDIAGFRLFQNPDVDLPDGKEIVLGASGTDDYALTEILKVRRLKSDLPQRLAEDIKKSIIGPVEPSGRRDK